MAKGQDVIGLYELKAQLRGLRNARQKSESKAEFNYWTKKILKKLDQIENPKNKKVSAEEA